LDVPSENREKGNHMQPEIAEKYGNKVRIRVCGLCWENDRLLLINHNLYTGHFWSPPGGGIDYGDTAEKALKKEFLEETGLIITVQQFSFACQVIKPPLHAIELFFQVKREAGTLKKGYDPETTEQIIKEVRFLDEDEVYSIATNQRHGIFNHCNSLKELKVIQGYFQI
jgi:8-oxo-dGTP diphosphatase